MSPFHRRIAILVLVLAGPAVPAVHAQAVWQADVQLQSLIVTRRATPLQANSRLALTGRYGSGPATLVPPAAIDITVTVFSNNDDDARSSQLQIFLPVETKPLSVPAGCQASPQPAGITSIGFVTCDIGDLPVNGSRTVQLSITVPPSYVVPKVSAFAWSISPDPNLANNYAERVAQ